MTNQADPFDAMGRSFNALQGAWDQGTRNQAGRAYASGDAAGATNALASGGLLAETATMKVLQRGEEERSRSGQIAGALRTGDFTGARSFAQSPEELAAIDSFKASASANERAQAAAQAGRVAAVATAVQGLPPAEQRAAALQYATQFGIDPAQIPAQITPGWLEGIRVQALGLEEYLKYQDREADNRRPIQGPYGIIWPEGTTPAQIGAARGQGQPEYVDQLPPGVRPRPNQPLPAPAAGRGERSQTPSVSFRSSNEAQQSVARLVPGVNVTNADRTSADTARIRAQGYTPSDTSYHLRGQALDLTPPRGMTMAQLEAKMRQAGFRVLNEGHHVHVSW